MHTKEGRWDEAAFGGKQWRAACAIGPTTQYFLAHAARHCFTPNAVSSHFPSFVRILCNSNAILQRGKTDHALISCCLNRPSFQATMNCPHAVRNVMVTCPNLGEYLLCDENYTAQRRRKKQERGHPASNDDNVTWTQTGKLIRKCHSRCCGCVIFPPPPDVLIKIHPLPASIIFLHISVCPYFTTWHAV